MNVNVEAKWLTDLIVFDLLGLFVVDVLQSIVLNEIKKSDTTLLSEPEPNMHRILAPFFDLQKLYLGTFLLNLLSPVSLPLPLLPSKSSSAPRTCCLSNPTLSVS